MPDADLPTLLLAHNPDAKDVADGYPWQVMIAGHTHGGQILVPVVGTRFVAIKDKRFVAGLRGGATVRSMSRAASEASAEFDLTAVPKLPY